MVPFVVLCERVSVEYKAQLWAGQVGARPRFPQPSPVSRSRGLSRVVDLDPREDAVAW